LVFIAKRHTMKQLLLSAFSLFFILTSAQAQNHEIIGSIRSGDGKSLSDAHILDINSRIAVVADAHGKFQLSVPDSGTALRVSHIGFRPVLFNLTSEMKYEKSVSIILSQQSTMLSPAVVSVTDKIVIDGKRGVVLRDFSFSAGNNLLLLAKNGIRYLVLCDKKWQGISRIEVGKIGDRLYEDCLGNMHLFGNDSVYQIGINANQLEFVSVTDRTFFVEQMAHCATSSDNYIFFSSYKKAGQEVYHYGLERNTKQGVILQHVYDHNRLQDIQDYFSDLPHQRLFNSRFRRAGSSFENERLTALRALSCCGNGNTPVANNSIITKCVDPIAINRYENRISNSWSRRNRANWGASNQKFNTPTQYFQSVSNRALEHQQAMLNTWSPSPSDRGWMDLLQQPTYSPMFNLRDSIFVFDHSIGVCYVHNENGQEIRSFPIEHQETKGWRNILIPDENGEKIYAQVRKRNKVYLMEIDLNDGRILGSAYLPNATFIEHLKINDGYAFYLKQYRDLLTSDRMLMQRL
jgi:hypothetical protein